MVIIMSVQLSPNSGVYDEAAKAQGRAVAVVLTPRQRFRQAEPSWFFSGHTTSLVASETEKELVKEDLGGIPS
jgi:hypothetical protein